MDSLERLQAAAQRYNRAVARLDTEREAAINGVVAALRDGHAPADVVAASPFSVAYVRQIRQEAGLPPATSGPKPSAKRRGRPPRTDREQQ